MLRENPNFWETCNYSKHIFFYRWICKYFEVMHIFLYTASAFHLNYAAAAEDPVLSCIPVAQVQ